MVSVTRPPFDAANFVGFAQGPWFCPVLFASLKYGIMNLLWFMTSHSFKWFAFVVPYYLLVST